MASAPPTKKLKVEGMTYHERSKALHLRIVDSDVLVEVATLLRHHHDLLRFNTDVVPHYFLESQSLHLSIGESFFRPHPPFIDTDNDQQQQMSREEQQLMALCSAVADCLPELQEIHLGRALSGFIHSNVGAWCPVEAIQFLLASANNNLECVMLRNLQVYSSQQQHQQHQQEHTGEQPNNNINVAALLLAKSLKGHPTLRRFGWQHSELVPRAHSSLDPLLQALSTTPNLTDVIVQCPPWIMATATNSTDPRLLTTLVGPNLRGLHMDGLHLHDDHVQSLLLTPTTSLSSLQSLTLSLQLTMGNIAALGHILAEVLLTTPSLMHVGLRLDWLTTNEDNPTTTSRPSHRQRLRALQIFQDTIAQSFLADNSGSMRKNGPDNPRRSLSQLERLDLIYYDSSQRCNNKEPPMISPQVFRKVLESKFSLTHLRLPYCGEMEPSIDFLLKLNRTGLRRCLLAQDRQPTRQQCLEGLLQVQQDHGCWTKVSTPLALSMSKNTLSSIYYLLHEMPCLLN